MKKYLLLIPAALGLFALIPTNSKAQDFSFSVGVAPGYYEPGYFTMAATAIPGMGIITTGAFIIAPPGIQVITMATATTVAIIARTMINRGLMRNRIDSWPLHASDCADSSRVWQTRGALIWAALHTDKNTKLLFELKACGSRAMKRLFIPLQDDQGRTSKLTCRSRADR